MPEIMLQSVGQDVGDSSTDHKEEENNEDHKENDSSTVQKEAKISDKYKGGNDTDKCITTEGGVFCKICLVTLTSGGQADKHFNGLRHKTAVTSLIEHTRESSSGVTPPQRNTSKDLHFFCELCLIKLTSPSQLDVHFKGKKHQRALAALKDHPRSLVELAASQDCIHQDCIHQDCIHQDCIHQDCIHQDCIQSSQDVDSAVKPRSRSHDDPAGEESSQIEASPGNTASSKTSSSSVTSLSASQGADGDGNNQKEGTLIKPKKRKKPKGEEIICSVCSLKLTSEAQAETHYQGMKHKRALASASGQTRPIPPLIRNQNIYSNFAAQNFHPFAYRNAYDQRMGYLMPQGASKMKPKNEKEAECVCRICVVKLTSLFQAVMHYEGRQHRRAAALVAANSQQKPVEGNQKTEQLVCEVCHVTLTSQAVADTHYASSKHKKKAQLFQSRCGLVPETQGRPDTEGMCGICNVALPSKVVADAHYAGAKHNKKMQIMKSLLGNGKTSESPNGNRKASESSSGNGKASKSPSGNGEAGNVGTEATASLVAASSSSDQVTESSLISVMSSTGELLDEQRKALAGNLFSCDICKIKGTSKQQMEEHYRGVRHLHHVLGPVPRSVIINVLSARRRFTNGGVFPGNCRPWREPPAWVRYRPTVQYRPCVW